MSEEQALEVLRAWFFGEGQYAGDFYQLTFSQRQAFRCAWRALLEKVHGTGELEETAIEMPPTERSGQG